jgi:L-ascorbate metabolism protein UlaG (beta-lactamase superfamily)
MRITHIYHSGFAVELASCNLLFDWYTGELPALSADVPLAVFVSYEHSDHYNLAIWGL